MLIIYWDGMAMGYPWTLWLNVGCLFFRSCPGLAADVEGLSHEK